LPSEEIKYPKSYVPGSVSLTNLLNLFKNSSTSVGENPLLTLNSAKPITLLELLFMAFGSFNFSID
jgi:hypothetical protein